MGTRKNCTVNIRSEEVGKKSDSGLRMEVCPHCKKPFKRLKSHLPYCKMVAPTVSAEGKGSQSKPAALARAKKERRPPKNSTKAKGQELETEGEKEQATRASDRPERTAVSFPRLGEAAGSTEAGREVRIQSRLAIGTLTHPEPKETTQRERSSLSSALDASSPRRELARIAPEAEEGGCHPSGRAAASVLGGSVESSLCDQERKCSSVRPRDVQTTSVNLKLDPIDPQTQRLLVTFPDVPAGHYQHPPKDLGNRAQRVGSSTLGKESGSPGAGHPSGVSTAPRNTEAWGKASESLASRLRPHPLGEIQVRERGELGAEPSSGRDGAEKNVSGPETRVGAPLIHSHENLSSGTSATVETWQGGDQLLKGLTPWGTASSKLASVSEADRPSLASVAVQCLCLPEQVLAVTVFVDSKEQASLVPRPASQPHAVHTRCQEPPSWAQPPVCKSPLLSHVVAPGALPSSVGLEWFPELYPGYAGLGVLPRAPQHWNSVTQVPPLTSSRGGHLSQVPWAERSSADIRSLEPPARLAASTFPLPRLWGALRQGWIQCNTTIKRSGLGLTMFFTGYFILCCNWSFRHLKLQRWRKGR